jgi:putative aldouronate transport system permease protein
MARAPYSVNRSSSAGRVSSGALHAMLLPAALLIFVFSYLPLGGLVMAFQDFDIFKGLRAIVASDWVGWGNFARLIQTGDLVKVVRNTVVIAFWKIALSLGFPILVSVLLNEVRSNGLKRTIQTVIYLPHFISWIIMGGIIRQMLLSDGTLNQLIVRLFEVNPVPFLSSNALFVPTLVVTDLWKGFGFATVIYLAAISAVDPNLYEAAEIDGANRWRQTLHVTLPGMMPIIVLTAVLALQNVLNAGFDQVFNLYSAQVFETGDIIDTYVYRITFQSGTPQYHVGTAVGLFKSAVSFVFISVSYFLAYRVANYRIF